MSVNPLAGGSGNRLGLAVRISRFLRNCDGSVGSDLLALFVAFVAFVCVVRFAV